MSAAAFSSTAQFLWSRNRTDIVFCALAYVPLIIGSAIASVAHSTVFRSMALGYLFISPVIFPLVIFVGSGLNANADLTAPEGLFPRHYFVLPAAVHQIVLPFMLYAALFAAAQWSLADLIDGGRLLGQLGGRLWVPLLATSFVVWMQALLWTPVRHRLVRALQLLGLLSAYLLVFVEAARAAFPAELTLALSTIQFPIAYAAALAGVAKSRRGDPSPFVAKRNRAAAPTSLGPRKRALPHFASPLDAQLWMERRIHRWADKSILFVLIPGLLLLVLFLAAVMGAHESGRDMLRTLGTAIIILLSCALVLIGLSTGLNFGSFSDRIPWQRADVAHLMPPYFAALPFSTGEFAWAKIRIAVERMLCVSVGFVVVAAVAAKASGLSETWLAHHAGWRAEYGIAGTFALGALTPIAFVMLTLSATANVMWVVLTGRLRSLVPWMSCAACALCLLSPVVSAKLVAFLPIIVPITAVVKVCGLLALLFYVGSRRLLSWSRLAMITGFWAATAGSLAAWISWYVPDELPTTPLGIAIVMAPVLGAVAAPVALSWNRAR